jgi:hypothetical protein
MISTAYEFRTKSAQSRGLEKDGRRERIFCLSRGIAVQRFAREGPCLLGIFARVQASRECLARCDWRRETNRNPTFSGLWINVGGRFAHTTSVAGVRFRVGTSHRQSERSVSPFQRALGATECRSPHAPLGYGCTGSDRRLDDPGKENKNGPFDQ